MTELLTATETARLLKVHPATLATWRVEGRGPTYIKTGPRNVRYRLSDVDDWLDSQSRTSTKGHDCTCEGHQ